LVEASMGVGIVMKPQNYNETSKFQLVEVSINSGITSLNEESTLNAIPALQKNPSRWFGYP